MSLQACLNGSRRRSEHKVCPITPGELADAGAAAVAAGATSLHVHPRDGSGVETLHSGSLAATLEAMRTRVSVPIGITTGAWVASDERARRRAIESWEVLPDFASVNFHEHGAEQTARLLLGRGVGLEAGIWSDAAATVLVRTGLADQAVRILVEPMEQDLHQALRNVAAIERRLQGCAPDVVRLLHGFEATAWPILDHARRHGHDVRIGFEDTLRGPDGSEVAGNTELVAIAQANRGWSGPGAGTPHPQNGVPGRTVGAVCRGPGPHTDRTGWAGRLYRSPAGPMAPSRAAYVASRSP